MSGPRAMMLSAAVLALILLILAARRVPMAPILIAPPDAQVERSSSAIDFKWRYGGMAYRDLITWRRADHFVVCIQEYVAGDFPCSYPQSTDEPPWAGAVGDFPAVSAAPGTPWAESIKIYTHTVDQLPAELHGVDLMWTVAACASTSANSCNYAVPKRQLRVADVNLTADYAHISYVGGTDIKLESSFSNNGSAHSGSFDVKLEVAQLRLDSSNAPIKNLNAPGINPAVDEVFLKNGEIKTIDVFLASGGDPADVKGILVQGGFRHTEAETITAGLSPNDVGHFNTPPMSVPQFAGPAGTVVGLFLEVIVDPANLIAEPNEFHSDNTQQDRYIYIVPP